MVDSQYSPSHLRYPDLNTTHQHPSDPLLLAQGVYVVVHGHFYQPPRENPYLDAIERQPSAEPFHDWNQRIHHECYRPNAFARIWNDQGRVVGIVNNYEYLSFNLGPTLLNWLERYDLETYQRVLEADRKSCERLNGHGNAIAQAYNHIILPLANEQDKYTQIRWGKADFRSRFGRDPEGMWLAETAVDYPTLEALVAEGIRFIILAPSQAQRCRPIAQDTELPWQEVGGGQIDPTQPYRCFLPGGNPASDYIDIFFYDGPISRDLGFNQVLQSSQHFAGRIGQAVRGDRKPAQLISVATDGETFGHHKRGTEKALAYALTEEFPRRGWTVTNYAHYLTLNPPTWEVQLKPVTAWSCSHGVDRWQSDCGCGGGGTWHQKWRRPLRDALNWLRDQLIQVYEEAGQDLFQDPWKARDQYIEVVRDRSTSTIDRFLTQHQTHPLTPAERVDALRLLEMQRYALFMYTSCGWFFEELSRPEGTQILRYAARALELAGDVCGLQLEQEFLERLALAPSNIEQFRDGAGVYRQCVIPSQISFDQIAAHYAISSLFTTYGQEHRVHCYTIHQEDYQLQRMGNLTLAMGQLRLVSDITQEQVPLMFAVLHLGGWDFHCCIQDFKGRLAYSQIKDKIFDALKQASAAQVIFAMSHIFGNQSYTLQDLFAEERHRIMRLLSDETLTRLNELYTQVYRDNYGVLMAFQRDQLPVPRELQVAAEIALGHRALSALRNLERDTSDLSSHASSDLDSPAMALQIGGDQLRELEAIATEASYFDCRLQISNGKQILEQLILRSLWRIFHDSALNSAPNSADYLAVTVEWLQRLIALGQHLELELDLNKAQELYLQHLPNNLDSEQWQGGDLIQKSLLQLGKCLNVATGLTH